jgi:hypothetical protein
MTQTFVPKRNYPFHLIGGLMNVSTMINAPFAIGFP